MEEVRCGECNRKLAAARFIEIEIKCPRCGTLNYQKAAEPPTYRAQSAQEGEHDGKPNHSLDRRQT